MPVNSLSDMSQAAIRVTKWKTVTEEQALDEDWDQIPTLTAFAKTQDFCHFLDVNRVELEGIISRHLRIPSTEFLLLDRERWIWGSFNICLPIDIKCTRPGHTLPRRAMLRFALPFRCGEEYSPGNVNEKLRCESATYIWLRRCCPRIPTPRLLAMGFPGAEAYTAIENESLWHRIIWQIRRCRTWLRGDTLVPYFQHSRQDSLSNHGYLLLEYVMNGQMLSSSWQKNRHDDIRRDNLYRGISKIMLDLANLPLPRIGSWTLGRNGIISLTNRPVTDLTMLWNRHEIPTGISREMTRTSSVSYLQDLLTYQDNRMRYQPNSILARKDGVFQLSALAALRTLLPVFWKQEPQNEAFVLTLPDLHKSNMFVDNDWNIVNTIDFEFAPVQPQQVVNVPDWLSDKSVDELYGTSLDEYKTLYDRFVDIMEEEEMNRGLDDHVFSRRLREDWRTGRVWYNAALRNSNAFPLIFENSIQPRFFRKFEMDVEGTSIMQLWSEDCEEFIAAKIQDKERYDQRIRDMFAAARQSTTSVESKDFTST